MADHYETLDLERKASFEEIKSAFRAKAIQCHPDKVPQEKKAWAHERFNMVSKAYFVLSDPEKRRRYDEALSKQKPEPRYEFKPADMAQRLRRDFGDLFADFFDEKMFLLLIDHEVHMRSGDLRDKETTVVLWLAILTVPTVALCLLLFCFVGFKIAEIKGILTAIVPALLLSWFILGWLYNAIEKMYATPFERALQRKFKDWLR